MIFNFTSKHPESRATLNKGKWLWIELNWYRFSKINAKPSLEKNYPKEVSLSIHLDQSIKDLRNRKKYISFIGVVFYKRVAGRCWLLLFLRTNFWFDCNCSIITCCALRAEFILGKLFCRKRKVLFRIAFTFTRGSPPSRWGLPLAITAYIGRGIVMQRNPQDNGQRITYIV